MQVGCSISASLLVEDLGDGLELSHSIIALMRVFDYTWILGHQDLYLIGPYFP